MASLPVAWMASTIADGAAALNQSCADISLILLTGAFHRDQLVFQVAFDLGNATKLMKRVRDRLDTAVT